MYCYCVRYDNKLHHVVNIGTDTTEILPGYTNTVLLVETPTIKENKLVNYL